MLTASNPLRPTLSSSLAQARSLRRRYSVGTVVQDLCNPIAPVQLHHDEVHVYWAFNDKIGESCWERFQQCLTPEETAAINNVTDIRVKRQRVLARALTRTILPAYILECCDAQDLEFLKNEHGKPFIAPRHFQDSTTCDVDFNLTHTTSVVGCAVGRGLSVGLDVEELSRQPRNVLRLAKRWLSPLECDLLAGVSGEEDRARTFLQLWTLKEALVKARGTGISGPPGLSGFSIGLHEDVGLMEQLAAGTRSGTPAAGGLRITLDSDRLPEGTAAFEFRLLQPSPDHVAALCIMRPAARMGGELLSSNCGAEEHQQHHQQHHHHHHHGSSTESAASCQQWPRAAAAIGHHQGCASSTAAYWVSAPAGGERQGRHRASLEAHQLAEAAGGERQGRLGLLPDARPSLAVRCWEVAGYGDVLPMETSDLVLGSS